MEDSRYELRKGPIGSGLWDNNVPVDSTSQNLDTVEQSSTGWAIAWNTFMLLGDGGMGPEIK